MYMERGKRANALGMDSFDRAVETWAVGEVEDVLKSDSISALCSSVSPLTYTTCAANSIGTELNSVADAISSITLDGKQLTIRDNVAVTGVDKLKDEIDKMNAAIKRLGQTMGVDPFKNAKIDFEEFIIYGDRLRRSELKTI